MILFLEWPKMGLEPVSEPLSEPALEPDSESCSVQPPSLPEEPAPKRGCTIF